MFLFIECSKVSPQLGVPVGKTIVAFSAGDMWTNMFQPFWAIALLGITSLRAGHIIGYTFTLLLLAAPFFALGICLYHISNVLEKRFFNNLIP